MPAVLRHKTIRPLQDMTLAIVDVETTGASVTGDRIIEIAVLRIEQGRLVRTFETLLDPEQRIPSYIEGLTGITNDDVAGAPTFRAIHDELEAILEGCVFVAHNVRFDYGLIRNECSRLGCQFSAPCLCTVRLSRRLYPHHRRHSLSDLIERFHLTCVRRHRALGDAQALWDFLQIAQQECGAVPVGETIATLLKTPTLPPRLVAADLEQLPNGPGVYIFYDETGQPLYVGKSRSVRTRVLSHFSGDHASGKEMRLCQAVARIESHATYGELGALLLESQLIKTLAPLHNRRLRSARELAVIRKASDARGYATLRIERRSSDEELPISDILGICRSVRQAKALVADLATAHHLCPRVLGLERRKGSCLYRQIKQCRGACTAEEPPELFNARLDAAFVSRRLRTWPYPGPVLLEEANASRTEGHVFVLDNWRLVKALRYGEDGMRTFLPARAGFDHDAYNILVAHVLRRAHAVTRLSAAEVMRLCEQT